LVDTHQGAGTHTAVWHGKDNKGTNVASGIYFVRLLAEETVITKKMVLVK
jgi:flagellar hook assembly protein FlgD